jgi:hypothetical protein
VCALGSNLPLPWLADAPLRHSLPEGNARLFPGHDAGVPRVGFLRVTVSPFFIIASVSPVTVRFNLITASGRHAPGESRKIMRLRKMPPPLPLRRWPCEAWRRRAIPNTDELANPA